MTLTWPGPHPVGTTTADPSLERGGRSVDQAVDAVPRPGLIEQTLTVFLIFINQFGTPASWFTVNTGSSSGPESDILLSYGSLAVIGVLMFSLIGHGDAVVRVLTASPLMVVYFFAIGLSPIWSDHFSTSLTAAVNVATMVALAVVLLVRYTPNEIFKLIAIAMSIGVVMDLLWVLFMGSLGIGPTNGFWDGLATQKNALGNHGLLGVVIFLVGARTFRRFRIPFYGLAVIALALLVGSESKTSLGTAVITAGCFVVFMAFRARKTLNGAVILTLTSGVAVAVLFVTANLVAIAGQFGKDATFTGRTPLWSLSWSSVMERPWLGYGYDGYFNGPLSAAHRITAQQQFDWNPTHAHNGLLESALHVGIPLTILYIVFNVQAIIRATSHVRWVRGPAGLFPLVYLTMITMLSTTESGFFTMRFGITLYVIAVVQAKIGVDEARWRGELRLDEERRLRRQGAGFGPAPATS